MKWIFTLVCSSLAVLLAIGCSEDAPSAGPGVGSSRVDVILQGTWIQINASAWDPDTFVVTDTSMDGTSNMGISNTSMGTVVYAENGAIGLSGQSGSNVIWEYLISGDTLYLEFMLSDTSANGSVDKNAASTMIYIRGDISASSSSAGEGSSSNSLGQASQGVTSPVAGDQWIIGTSATVTWIPDSLAGSPLYVSVDLRRNGVALQKMGGPGIVNAGELEVTTAFDLPTGSGYMIRVYASYDTLTYIESAAFTLVD